MVKVIFHTSGRELWIIFSAFWLRHCQIPTFDHQIPTFRHQVHTFFQLFSFDSPNCILVQVFSDFLVAFLYCDNCHYKWQISKYEKAT